jgi:hypothetical protein
LLCDGAARQVPPLSFSHSNEHSSSSIGHAT